MKIKTKLTLGVGLLFILIILLILVGTKYLNTLKNATENILVANYNTMQYSRNMLFALEDTGKNAHQIFEKNLALQERNITESGEKGMTAELRKNFELYQLHPLDESHLSAIRKGIFKIMDLNMKAIERKSELAKATANEAVFWVAVTGTICFLIAFVLLVNLPSNIANPIKALTQSIQQIAAKNYTQRVYFEDHSEFGQLAKSFNTMAEKLEEYNSSNLAKLMKEKKRIETLINNMNDPVIGLDENLKVIFANEQAAKITGLAQEEMIGFFSQDLAVKNDLVRMLIKDLVVPEKEHPIKAKPLKIYTDHKEGYFEKQTLHISITPTGEEQQELIGHFLILRNITEYKELDFAKTNFIATLSHEFKTPISSIKLSLQLLQNKEIGLLNEEQKNLLESIGDDISRLLKITSELLNMTQVESGNIQLSITPSNPKEILAYAIQATQTQADQKHIQFQLDCPNDTAFIQADREKTAWILTNLIANAIRYSYENSTIYLKIEEQEDRIKIAVRDTGQGIAPQYKDKVFNRYFRVPGTKKEGTGLGLAISKEFIEAQNGEITVESELGKGSVFTISLRKIDGLPSAV